jgi:hypothetical protein
MMLSVCLAENARAIQISEGALMIAQGGGILNDLNIFFENYACFT